MRRPLGTNFARPSGHDSLANETLLKIVLLSLTGTAADIICCQILWFHSLASVDEAVKTIRGEAMGEPPQKGIKSLSRLTQTSEIRYNSGRCKSDQVSHRILASPFKVANKFDSFTKIGNVPQSSRSLSRLAGLDGGSL